MADNELRWVTELTARAPTPHVDAFLRDVLAVCEKHGFSIAHEDSQGGFIITPFDSGIADWLLAASVEGVDGSRL